MRDSGWREAHGTDQTALQVVQDMVGVTIHLHALAVPPVVHLAVFDADVPIVGDAFDQAGSPVFIDLSVLRFELPDHFQRG